jgi:hypothetical protein
MSAVATVQRWFRYYGGLPTREQWRQALGVPPQYHDVTLCPNCQHQPLCGRVATLYLAATLAPRPYLSTPSL